MADTDLVIVGAGPAGMAAARLAAEKGLHVLALDEQPRAGGQIYRNVGKNQYNKSWLGKDYAAGSLLVEQLDHPRIATAFRASVWRIERGVRVIWSRDGISRIACAPRVLITTGAQERAMPFPGWTLPGVMSVGAAQILMKTAGLLPRDAALAGSGPLLYLVAAQMIAAGQPPKALVETQKMAMFLRGLPHLPRAMSGAKTLFRGLDLLRRIHAAGVRRHTGASRFRAIADDDGRLTLRFNAKRRELQIRCSLLLTHQGVVPSTHMTRSAGIAHRWNSRQKAFQPVTDAWGRTNISGFYVAGDGAGVNGAEAAVAMGRLAALDILYNAGRLTRRERDSRAVRERSALKRARAVRPFLDAIYAPPEEFLSPPDETIICRCEEVTAAEVRQAVCEGATGHRQIKIATRVGMGSCQGRMCELTARGILAACNCRIRNIAPPRARTPVKTIKLAELAALSRKRETLS